MIAHGDHVSASLSPVTPPAAFVVLPASYVLAGCGAVSVAILWVARATSLPVWLLAAEVVATTAGLFLCSSFRYRVSKNAVTYGMLPVGLATFHGLTTSTWHRELAAHGWMFWVGTHLLSFRGLDDLIHADTMLFILGLALFVSVIAQARLLEGLTFVLLRRNRGLVVPTVIAVTAVVAIASGVFGGVSLIGLTIRTLVMILMLGGVPVEAVRYAVMVCTTVTTICGVWTAYGEPPNLIMKANLYPHLGNRFFLLYGVPVAVASYLVIAWQLRGKLGDPAIDLAEMDVLDANAEDVRFLQAARHGEVMTPVELIEGHADDLDGRAGEVMARLRHGETLGAAMVRAEVPAPVRRALLGHFVLEELADGLDRHYQHAVTGESEMAFQAEQAVDDVLESMGKARRRAQRFGALALLPLIALLAVHAVHNDVPLFLASFAAFLTAFPGIAGIPKTRDLALREAFLEYGEYAFLFPLFLSVTLLSSAGFFDGLQRLVLQGVATLGPSHMAFAQFAGSTGLSAVLDNNVVADFTSRGLAGLDARMLHFFAMAQIAGYALGGCWTHLGSTQSLVAFAFIQRDVAPHYTPIRWIKEMTPVVLRLLVVMGLLIYAEGAILSWL